MRINNMAISREEKKTLRLMDINFLHTIECSVSYYIHTCCSRKKLQVDVGLYKHTETEKGKNDADNYINKHTCPYQIINQDCVTDANDYSRRRGYIWHST